MQPPQGLHTVPSFPAYAVSRDGVVFSSRRGEWKAMKPRKNKCGYMQLVFSVGDKQFTRLVHRVVLESIVGPCPDGFEACHNDGNKENNRADNLRWDTRKANHVDLNKHGKRFAPRGEKSGSVKLTEEQVVSVFAKRESGMLQKEIAAVMGVARQTIGLILSGKNWSHLNLSKN